MENQLVLLVSNENSTLGRLDLARQLKEYFSKDGCRFNGAFVDFGRLVGGLASWIDSSSLQVTVAAMEILSLIVHGMQKDFYLYLNMILGPLIKNLGDSKKQVREISQTLILQLMEDCVGNPQLLLDRLMDACIDRNWRMKEEVLICLVRTLQRFGKEDISMDKYINTICTLMRDADSKVRKAAMDTLIDIYLCVGEELLIDLSNCDVHKPQVKIFMKKLNDMDHQIKQCPKPEDHSSSGESGKGTMTDSSSTRTIPITSKGKDIKVSKQAHSNSHKRALPVLDQAGTNHKLLSPSQKNSARASCFSSLSVSSCRLGPNRCTRDLYSVKSYQCGARSTTPMHFNSGSVSNYKSRSISGIAKPFDSHSVRSSNKARPKIGSSAASAARHFNFNSMSDSKSRQLNASAKNVNSTRSNKKASPQNSSSLPKYFGSDFVKSSETRTEALGTNKLEPENKTAKHFYSTSGSNNGSGKINCYSLGSTTTTSTSAATESGATPGGLSETDFIKMFSCVEEERIHTKYEFEQKLYEVFEILKNIKNKWDVRMAALQDFRKLVHLNQMVISREDYATQMKAMIDVIVISLKDRRSQMIKEVCVTVSYITTILGHHAASLGADILPLLLPLLANSTKVIASAGDVCIKFIIKNSLCPPILHCLATEGSLSKSYQIRRCCAGYLESCITYIKNIQLSEGLPLIETLLTCAIHDFDCITRTVGRKAFWKYQTRFPLKAKQFLEVLSQKEQKYIHAENPGRRELGNGGVTRSPIIQENNDVKQNGGNSKKYNHSPVSRCFKEKDVNTLQASYKESNHDSMLPPFCRDSSEFKSSIPMKLVRLQETGSSMTSGKNREIQHINIGVQTSSDHTEAIKLESVVKETVEQMLKFQQNRTLLSASLNKAPTDTCQMESDIEAYVTKLLSEKQPFSQPEFICTEPNSSSLQPCCSIMNETEGQSASSNNASPLQYGPQQKRLSNQKKTAAEEHVQKLQHFVLLEITVPSSFTPEQKSVFKEADELDLIDNISEPSQGQDVIPPPLPFSSSSAFQDAPVDDTRECLDDLLLPPPYPFSSSIEKHSSAAVDSMMDGSGGQYEFLTLSQSPINVNVASAKGLYNSPPDCSISSPKRLSPNTSNYNSEDCPAQITPQEPLLFN